MARMYRSIKVSGKTTPRVPYGVDIVSRNLQQDPRECNLRNGQGLSCNGSPLTGAAQSGP